MYLSRFYPESRVALVDISRLPGLGEYVPARKDVHVKRTLSLQSRCHRKVLCNANSISSGLLVQFSAKKPDAANRMSYMCRSLPCEIHVLEYVRARQLVCPSHIIRVGRRTHRFDVFVPATIFTFHLLLFRH
jgi:hypothetical protein